jgi:hypothetical protein
MAKFAEPDTGELRRKPIRRSSHSGFSRKFDFHFTEFSDVRWIRGISGSDTPLVMG